MTPDVDMYKTTLTYQRLGILTTTPMVCSSPTQAHVANIGGVSGKRLVANSTLAIQVVFPVR